MPNFRRSWQIALFLSLTLCSFVAVSTAAAQSGVEISADEVVQSFPNSVLFSLVAQSDVGIEEITLRYGTNGRSCQSNGANQPVDITPGTSVEASWEWDWNRFGILPPGTIIWWQWEITDADGQIMVTERQTSLVADNRFLFKNVTRDNISLFWIEGGEAFGNQMLDIASAGLLRLEEELGIQLNEPITLVVYPTAADVQEAVIHVPEWAGGVAYPRYNSIIVGILPGQDAWAESVIPHELTHLLVGALTFNCIGINLPTWLNEGLAEFGETGFTSDIDADLLAALDAGTVPGLRRLGSGFSAYGSGAGLAYVQSKTIVNYLINEFGRDKIRELLLTMQAGAQIDDALMAVYGLDTDTLDAAWRNSLGYQPLPTRQPTPDPSLATAVPTIAPFTLTVSTETPTAIPTATAIPPTATMTPQPAETMVPTALPTETVVAVAAVATEALLDSNPIEAPENDERTGDVLLFVGIGVVALVLLLVIVFIGRKIMRPV